MLLLAFPFMVLQTAWASGRHEVFRTKEFRRSNRYAMILSDMLVNLKLVKSMNKESWALEKVNTAFREKAAGGLATSLFFSKMHLVSDLFSKIFTAVFTIAGGLMIIKGGLTLGTFSAVSMYAILMVSEASHVSFFIEEIIAERPSLKRSAHFIREVTGMTAAPVQDKGPSGKTLSGDMEYRNVTFGYRPDHILFKDLSLVVPRGSWALVKGPSGSGKTTLICLFLKLLRPAGGSIHLGGEDIGSIPDSLFFKGISVVHQESYLFNDSLINNILLGDEKKRECCEKAFSAAGVDELAGGMLLGYNTRVGEMGLSLSGGQKQRIAIARALAREPEILILDEATSSLDPVSEENVLGNIKTLYPGITVVLVTHRESVLKYADLVFVLSEGRLNKEDIVHAA
jgi:ABC-type bacteriocin/lantibiotic exporter with double-glycine peptidase domain